MNNEQINVGNTASYTTPEYYDRIDVIEKEDCIEMIYQERNNTVYPPRYPTPRIFKIVFSCVDGKWHKSDRIYGKVVPAQKERYEFNEN